MRRIAAVVLPLLTFNLSLVGPGAPCAHEHQEPARATAASADAHLHAGHMPEQQEKQEKQEQEHVPCDDAPSGCCEALASCAISVAPTRAFRERPQPRLIVARIERSNDIRPASAPHEVATPPPRA